MCATNTIFLKNIEAIRKEKNMKLGDMEKEIGVSLGYFSRLGKNKESLPSMDIVLKVSKCLSISVDDLLKTNLYMLTGTERLVLDFIKKIFDDTRLGKLEWERENLITDYKSLEIAESKQTYGFKAYTNGHVYRTKISEAQGIEIRPLVLKHKGQEFPFVQMNMIDSTAEETAIIADGGQELPTVIRAALNDLYSCVQQGENKSNLSKETKKVLMDYLKQN